MTTPVARTSHATVDVLATAEQVVGKFPSGMRSGAVFRTQATPSVRKGEVYVIVLSAEGGLVSHRKLRGSTPVLRELSLRLAGAEAAVDALVRAPARVRQQLTNDEAALLDAYGLPEPDAQSPGALERTGIELELFMRESLSLDDAAKALEVSPSRLRQRLAPGDRTLYGIKDGRIWRLPMFQFVSASKNKLRLVRGIDDVLPAIRPEVPPLVVARWFSTPHQELVVGEAEESVTPLAWLSAGRSPAAVADLAAEL